MMTFMTRKHYGKVVDEKHLPMSNDPESKINILSYELVRTYCLAVDLVQIDPDSGAGIAVEHAH